MSSLREAHPKGLDFTTWKRPNAIGRGAEKEAKPYDLLPCHVANVPEGWGLGQSPILDKVKGIDICMSALRDVLSASRAIGTKRTHVDNSLFFL